MAELSGLKRLTKCPKCGNANPETFLFCAVGHSLCCECGFGDTDKECKSKEDRIKRFLERCHWVFEDNDIRMIFDYECFIMNTIDKIKNEKSSL